MNAVAPTERAVARWENEGGAVSHDLREHFPGVLDWHYLDTAATAQKPQTVLDAMMRAGGADYATVHRGVYARSANMTVAFEAARERVARFIGAASPNEIVFVRGATEGINLVAQSWGPANVMAGDRIMLSQLEHHSNIVPWQMLAEKVGAHHRCLSADRGRPDRSRLAGGKPDAAAQVGVVGACVECVRVDPWRKACGESGACRWCKADA